MLSLFLLQRIRKSSLLWSLTMNKTKQENKLYCCKSCDRVKFSRISLHIQQKKRSMKTIYEYGFKCNERNKTIRLVVGDLSKETNIFDLVICSAYKGVYIPTRDSFIGGLFWEKIFQLICCRRTLKQTCASRGFGFPKVWLQISKGQAALNFWKRAIKSHQLQYC